MTKHANHKSLNSFGLNNAQQSVFFKIVRQVEVDTVSNILGVLDGDTFLTKQRETFALSTESDSKKINGDLQGIFLEVENG